MPTKVWIGGTDSSYATAANWSPSGVPVDEDLLVFNEEAQQGMAGGPQTLKDHDVMVNRSFVFGIGSAGTPFEPQSFHSIIFQGSGSTPSYFKPGTGNIVEAIIDTQQQQGSLVNFDGTVTDLAIRSGSLALAAGCTLSGRASVSRPSGAGKAELIVAAGATLTGAQCLLNGGNVADSAGFPTVQVVGGTYVLDGTAGIATLLEVHDGGLFQWKAITSSTIALIQAYGGTIKTIGDKLGRTLTTGKMYGTSIMDFEQGGLSLTITNPIRCFGQNRPTGPKGATYTIGV